MTKNMPNLLEPITNVLKHHKTIHITAHCNTNAEIYRIENDKVLLGQSYSTV